MKFEEVRIVIRNVDEFNASVKVEFSPALPDNEEDIEEQPCLVILEEMLEVLRDEEGELHPKAEWVQ